MNFVSQLFSSNDVLLDLEVQSTQALFEAVGRLWEEHYGITATGVVERLLAREKLGSTGLGQGVAIPHARLEGLTDAVAAFVRLKEPIQFDSPDEKPVAYCFVLLVPVRATEQHLQILADVADMFSNAQFRDRLRAVTTREEAHRLFAEWRSPL